jgi:hypothetical protein
MEARCRKLEKHGDEPQKLEGRKTNSSGDRIRNQMEHH